MRTHTWLHDHNATGPQTLSQPWPQEMEHDHSKTRQGYKTTITGTYTWPAVGKDKVYKGVPIHILAGREGKSCKPNMYMHNWKCASNMSVTKWRQVGCSAAMEMQLIMINCWCSSTRNKVNISTNTTFHNWHVQILCRNHKACNTVKGMAKA